MSSTKTKERPKGSTRDYFSREAVMNSLRSIGSIRHIFTRSLIFSLGALALIVVIGAMVRSLPVRWGFYLTEFDPYWQYHQTQYIVDHGYLAWFSWHDNTVWFPWGRDVATTSYPGIPFSAAALYTFLSVLGLNLTVFDVCVIWPVLMGVLTIIVVYFLGKDIGGKEVGLFSALFIALSASHISRTSLGFFDDETVGVLLLVLVALLFLRSLDSRRALKGTLLYAIAAGLSLGYLQATWGASIYLVSLIALFAGVLIVFRKYTRRLLVSYSVTMSIAFLIAIQVPRIGVGFLTQLPTLSAIGVALLLCMMEFTRNIQNSKMKIVSFGVFFIALGSIYLLMEHFGIVEPLVEKYISVLNPFDRVTQPIIESVAEHRPATWASFFYEMGSILFIAPLGFYFLFRRSNVRDLFVAVLGITALYFAASMVRLTLILAPALAILASVAVVELVKPFINIARETVIFSKKRRFVPKVSREFGAIFVILLFLLVFPPLTRALFACELTPALGPSIRETFAGTYFGLLSKYLGDQWSIGDWEGLADLIRGMTPPDVFRARYGTAAEPPQNLKEYDPEWGKATVNGTISASCDHAQMLSHVKCPVLFTHHSRQIDEKSGKLVGSCTDQQVDLVEKLVKSSGQPFTRLSFPEMGHLMHSLAPELYVRTVVDWAETLPTEAETRRKGVFAKK